MRRFLARIGGAPGLLLLLAVGLELASWIQGSSAGTATGAWFRLQAHAGSAGLLAAAGAGAAAAALAGFLRDRGLDLTGRVGLALLGLAAALLQLGFLDMPQAQPDTVNYFVYAQRFAREPLGTLLAWPELAWSGDEARFHLPFPLVPLVYGLAFRLLGESWATACGVMGAFAAMLPVAVAWVGHGAGRPRTGLLAGWLSLGVPFLLAQTGWLLVDIPLLVLLCLAWGAMLRARGGRGLALALLACLPALATKASASLFLLGPAAALITERLRIARRWTLLALGLGGLGLLVWVHPPRWREDPLTWIEAALAAGVHLRPALWLLALPALLALERLPRVCAGVVLALPVIALYAPPEHAARYALPIGLALCLAAAEPLRRFVPAAAGLVVSGLVLAFIGYRPLLVHNQALNLQVAAQRLEARGVEAIELWSDQPDTNFAPPALAALVDIYVGVPVRFGGALRVGEPDDKRHWWEHYRPPPWHLAAPGEPPPDGVLLCLFGADAEAFEAGEGRQLELIEQVSIYRSSSTMLPSAVRLYRRPEGGAAPAPERRETAPLHGDKFGVSQ